MAIWNRKSNSSDGASPHTSDPEYGTKSEYQHATGEVPVTDSNGVVVHSDHTHLHRGLKSRHITMIAIGGAIGTGLIIGTGKALAQSGPASILIAYTSVGLIVYVVMTALGEMAAWIPHASGFAGYATRFCDPALGFALGWTYWCKYIITTPNQLTATALILGEWKKRDQVNPGVWIAIFLVAICAINYFGIKFFGELEFWLSSIKVITIVGIIILSFLLAVGAGPGPATGFKYYKNPGAFKALSHTTGSAGKFYGFWSSLVNAVFAYLGTELIGVTVGEAQNPRKTIPRAIKLTFYRILFFYCLSVFFLGMLVPYNSPELAFANKASTGASASPFVVAIRLAKIKHLPGIVNACILLFTFSASNSDLYIASRTLYGLAVEGHAPKIFLWTDKRGVPVPALAMSAFFCCTAFMNAADDSKTVFGYFVNLTTIFGLLSWISLLVSHIWFVRARNAQGITKDQMAYTAPFGLIGSYVALFFCVLIALTKNFNVFMKGDYGSFDYKNFITGYLGIPVYLICIFGYKFIMKSKMVQPHEADFYTGKDEIDREEEAFLAMAAEKKATQGKGSSWFYRTFIAWLI